MALLYMDGFEAYGTSPELVTMGADNPCRFVYLGSNSTYMVFSTTARTTQVTSANSRSMRSSSGLGVAGLRLPDLTEVIVGFGVMFDYTSNNYQFLTLGGSSPWNQNQGVTLAFHGGTGTITACVNSAGGAGTVLGTASGTYSNNTWYYVEARVKVGSSTGEVEMRINGSSVMNVTGVNTATGSLSYYSNIGFRGGSNYVYYDDLYVCDTTGSINNSFLGPSSVYTLMPTANGGTTDMTAVGAASNWQAVSEVTADTTSYVETSSTGAKDYFLFQSLPAGVSSVLGVMTRVKSTTPDNGGRKLRLNIKNGANVVTSTLKGLTMGSWLSDFFLRELAPDGSAWTKTSVDSMESGPEAG